MAQAALAPSGQEKRLDAKHLTFSLAGEEYGIEILRVKEIIGMLPVTPLPRTPPQVKGVINLRGKVIPVVDLRLNFGMPSVEHTDRTCIIVVEVAQADGLIQMGVIVDSVSEVLNIKGEEVEDPPSFGSGEMDTNFITGMAKIGDGVKILMDIDRALGGSDLVSLAH